MFRLNPPQKDDEYSNEHYVAGMKNFHQFSRDLGFKDRFYSCFSDNTFQGDDLRVSFIMGFIGSVLSVTAVTMAQGVEVNVRLVGSKVFEAGLVEVWKDGAWGLFCDGNRKGWNLEAGHLVCQNLGFAKARRVDHGSTRFAQVHN